MTIQTLRTTIAHLSERLRETEEDRDRQVERLEFQLQAISFVEYYAAETAAQFQQEKEEQQQQRQQQQASAIPTTKSKKAGSKKSQASNDDSSVGSNSSTASNTSNKKTRKKKKKDKAGATSTNATSTTTTTGSGTKQLRNTTNTSIKKTSGTKKKKTKAGSLTATAKTKSTAMRTPGNPRIPPPPPNDPPPPPPTEQAPGNYSGPVTTTWSRSPPTTKNTVTAVAPLATAPFLSDTSSSQPAGESPVAWKGDLKDSSANNNGKEEEENDRTRSVASPRYVPSTFEHDVFEADDGPLYPSDPIMGGEEGTALHETNSAWQTATSTPQEQPPQQQTLSQEARPADAQQQPRQEQKEQVDALAAEASRISASCALLEIDGVFSGDENDGDDEGDDDDDDDNDDDREEDENENSLGNSSNVDDSGNNHPLHNHNSNNNSNAVSNLDNHRSAGSLLESVQQDESCEMSEESLSSEQQHEYTGLSSLVQNGSMESDDDMDGYDDTDDGDDDSIDSPEQVNRMIVKINDNQESMVTDDELTDAEESGHGSDHEDEQERPSQQQQQPSQVPPPPLTLTASSILNDDGSTSKSTPAVLISPDASGQPSSEDGPMNTAMPKEPFHSEREDIVSESNLDTHETIVNSVSPLFAGSSPVEDPNRPDTLQPETATELPVRLPFSPNRDNNNNKTKTKTGARNGSHTNKRNPPPLLPGKKPAATPVSPEGPRQAAFVKVLLQRDQAEQQARQFETELRRAQKKIHDLTNQIEQQQSKRKATSKKKRSVVKNNNSNDASATALTASPAQMPSADGHMDAVSSPSSPWGGNMTLSSIPGIQQDGGNSSSAQQTKVIPTVSIATATTVTSSPPKHLESGVTSATENFQRQHIQV